MIFISNLARFLLTFLSFPHNLKKEKLSLNQINIIKIIQKKSHELNLINNHNSKLLTHKLFSNSVLSLIQKGNLENFLRLGFIQKMFFVHNRLYNVKFLRKIIKTKSKFWIDLLNECATGNPVPFFLNNKTSGNRIRHVFLLKEIFEFGSIKNIESVIEIGGGYGCMTSIIHKLNNNIDYTIFDLPEINLLQYYYLKSQNIDSNLDDIDKNINLLSNIKLLKKKLEILKSKNKSILLIANWSFSEMPIKLREELEFLFLNCNYGIISFQSYFEEISNVSYFEKLKKKLEFNYNSSIDTINEMNGKFNSNKYYTFLIKKKEN